MGITDTDRERFDAFELTDKMVPSFYDEVQSNIHFMASLASGENDDGARKHALGYAVEYRDLLNGSEKIMPSEKLWLGKIAVMGNVIDQMERELGIMPEAGQQG